MKLLRLFVVLFIPAIYSPLSLAQTETGAVSGTVTDPAGKLLQGAPITLTSTATRATRSSVSNAEGFGYCEHPQNFPRRPLTTRIPDLQRSQMTSGRVGGLDNVSPVERFESTAG
jgi:hypothetical protein